MPVIDSHTHFFSHDFFATLVAQQNPPGDPQEAFATIRERTGIEVPGPDHGAHAKRWLAAMDAAGIDAMVTFASLPQEADAVKAAMKVGQGRLVGYCLVNPLAENAPQFVESLKGRGFKGILLFPVMHRYAANDPRIHPTIEAAQGMNIIVHFGMLQVKLRDVLGLPRPFDLTYGNPLSLQVTANAFPKTRFIIPHFGCGFFRETLMIGSQCENVYVDTSSSNGWMATQETAIDLAGVFARTKNIFGAARILYGTDSSVFPRGYRKDVKDTQIDAMRQASYSDNDIDQVMGGNATALLND